MRTSSASLARMPTPHSGAPRAASTSVPPEITMPAGPGSRRCGSGRRSTFGPRASRSPGRGGCRPSGERPRSSSIGSCPAGSARCPRGEPRRPRAWIASVSGVLPSPFAPKSVTETTVAAVAAAPRGPSPGASGTQRIAAAATTLDIHRIGGSLQTSAERPPVPVRSGAAGVSQARLVFGVASRVSTTRRRDPPPSGRSRWAGRGRAGTGARPRAPPTRAAVLRTAAAGASASTPAAIRCSARSRCRRMSSAVAPNSASVDLDHGQPARRHARTAASGMNEMPGTPPRASL